MQHPKFSKETIWAVSIILICMLAGCLLIQNTKLKKTDIEVLSLHTDTITLQEAKNKPIESAVLPLDSTESKVLTEESSTSNVSVSTYQSPINFDVLWETNQDVYAWITIPGTVIDYPILQHETDDSYYLDYTIDGVKGYPGSIYTEHVNNKDFNDNNTVIYGHNMRNGTMFTDLHKFRESDFFETNDTVYIYTPTRQLTYKIFAAYLYDDRHLMNSFDFSNPKIYSNYLAEIQNIDSKDENANLRKEIQLADTDKIITLITCIRSQPKMRVYVQAVLQP